MMMILFSSKKFLCKFWHVLHKMLTWLKITPTCHAKIFFSRRKHVMCARHVPGTCAARYIFELCDVPAHVPVDTCAKMCPRHMWREVTCRHTSPLTSACKDLAGNKNSRPVAPCLKNCQLEITFCRKAPHGWRPAMKCTWYINEIKRSH